MFTTQNFNMNGSIKNIDVIDKFTKTNDFNKKVTSKRHHSNMSSYMKQKRLGVYNEKYEMMQDDLENSSFYNIKKQMQENIHSKTNIATKLKSTVSEQKHIKKYRKAALDQTSPKIMVTDTSDL